MCSSERTAGPNIAQNDIEESKYNTNSEGVERERILSLEGQAAELSDRVAAYEQAEMLRKVSEDDIIQGSAEDRASKCYDEDIESYKARLREAFRIKAEANANAEKKYEAERRKLEAEKRELEEEKREVADEKSSLKLEAHGLQLKTDSVNAAVKRLAADKTRFDEQKSELIKGVEAKYAKILEERDLMFRRRVEEVRNSLNAQMVEAEVSVLESFKRLVASVGGPAEEQERAIAELKLTMSEMTAKSVSGLVESAKKLQKSSRSKDRHIRYCLRKLFGSTSEKVHDDEVLSLVDSVLEGNGLEVGDKLLKEYKSAKEVVVRVKSLMELKRLAKESERPKDTGEDDPESECQMVDAAYLRSLPQHGAPVVLYPKEYLKDPSRYVEIRKQSGRVAHYELVLTPEKHEAMRYELPVFVERGNPDAVPIQAKVEDYRPYSKIFASPELVARWRWNASRIAIRYIPRRSAMSETASASPVS